MEKWAVVHQTLAHQCVSGGSFRSRRQRHRVHNPRRARVWLELGEALASSPRRALGFTDKQLPRKLGNTAQGWSLNLGLCGFSAVSSGLLTLDKALASSLYRALLCPYPPRPCLSDFWFPMTHSRLTRRSARSIRGRRWRVTVQERPTEHGLGVHGGQREVGETASREELLPHPCWSWTPTRGSVNTHPPTRSSVTSGRGCFPGGAVMDTGVDHQTTGMLTSRFKVRTTCSLYSLAILWRSHTKGMKHPGKVTGGLGYSCRCGCLQTAELVWWAPLRLGGRLRSQGCS